MALALVSIPKHASTGRSASARNKKAMPGRNHTSRQFGSDVARIGLPTLAPGHPVIQAKLKIGEPNDKYEQEADRVADEVMRMPEPGALTGTVQPQAGLGLHVQRMCSECEDEVQRQQIDEEEEVLQTKMTDSGMPGTDHNLGNRVNQLRGRGQPLPKTLRTFFEPRFGHDFSNVRLHTDGRAAITAGAINARAFTAGRDIVFGANQFAPGTGHGKKLLAHELTHTIQQGRSAKRAGHNYGLVQRQPVGCTEQVTDVHPPRDPSRELIDAHNVASNWAQVAANAVQTILNGGAVGDPVQRALDFHFGNPNHAQLVTIRNRLNRIITRLNRGTRIYRCSAGMANQADTFCPSRITERTRIFRQYFQASNLMRPLILVHEAAHGAGACADRYVDQPNYPGNHPPFNAEAYAQFIRAVGFYLGELPLRRRRRQLVLPDLDQPP